MSFSVLSSPKSPEVHASTLLLAGEYLLSAWFGGTKEGYADTKIWLSRRRLQDESEWTKPEVVASVDGEAHWNPVLLDLPRERRIVLFYKVGSPISSWRTYIKDSHDGGNSWSEAQELVYGDKGGRGPVKNKCIISSKGTVLAPASLETPDGRWDCFCDSSTDSCRTWSRSSPIKIDREKLSGEGAIQPALIERSSGKISMLTRSSTGYVLRTDSDDDGRTWSEMYSSGLYNNNSGLDALKLSSGQWVVVHNPVNRNWGPRTPLVVSVSDDEGKTWRRAATLEDKPPPKGFERIIALDTGIVNDGQSEFSYPAVIDDGEGGVYISYTYERVGIKHVHLHATSLM